MRPQIPSRTRLPERKARSSGPPGTAPAAFSPANPRTRARLVAFLCRAPGKSANRQGADETIPSAPCLCFRILVRYSSGAGLPFSASARLSAAAAAGPRTPSGKTAARSRPTGAAVWGKADPVWGKLNFCIQNFQAEKSPDFLTKSGLFRDTDARSELAASRFRKSERTSAGRSPRLPPPGIRLLFESLPSTVSARAFPAAGQKAPQSAQPAAPPFAAERQTRRPGFRMAGGRASLTGSPAAGARTRERCRPSARIAPRRRAS